MFRARDTSDGAFKRQLAAFRAMTPAERLAVGAAMSEEIRVLAEAGIRDRHPTYTEAQVADALAEILLGRELAEKVGRLRLSKPR
jgi:alpha-galactosidase/6-phospho-beta-glucosidase family protein